EPSSVKWANIAMTNRNALSTPFILAMIMNPDAKWYFAGGTNITNEASAKPSARTKHKNIQTSSLPGTRFTFLGGVLPGFCISSIWCLTPELTRRWREGLSEMPSPTPAVGLNELLGDTARRMITLATDYEQEARQPMNEKNATAKLETLETARCEAMNAE